MHRILTIAFFVTVFVIGAAFSAKNTGAVTVDFYFSAITLPLSVIIILSLVVGIVIGALAIFAGTLSLRYENRGLQKQLATAEQELNSLRILPIKNEH
ncbi:MAG: LapA family protein [Gammaproteobacteria bacterium]|nr:LapA family protein [Gammaproteobacteria bacterium]